jgi:hypothetical protein
MACYGKKFLGQDRVVGIATRHKLDGLESNPGEGKIFCTRPDCPWTSTSFYVTDAT